MTNESILYYIWLGSKLYPGSATPKLLLEKLEDIRYIYDATREEYEALGVPPNDCIQLCDKDLEDAKRYLDYCEKEHIGLLTYNHPYYPGRLRSIDSPPPLLYYRGRVDLIDDFPCFAMVGTRSCSEKGFRAAYRTAYTSAVCGAVVINGLALGCDTACIRGALDAGGYAIGLLGCGIDRIYPSQNRELFYRLSRQGLILSEFPPFTQPEGRNFPVRNRIISALSVATVVFEAGEGSGALITATHALNQGRRVFAVPGSVSDPLYRGPLSLLKEGARVFTEAADFLTEYSLMYPHRLLVSQRVTVPIENENAAVLEAFSVLEKAPAEKPRTLPKPQHSSPRPKVTKAKKERNVEKSEKSEKAEKSSERAVQKAVLSPSEAAPSVHTESPSGASPEKAAIKKEENTPDLSMLSPEEMKIYSLFTAQDMWTVDEIVAKGVKIDDALSSLTLLEVYGLVRSLPGGRYERS